MNTSLASVAAATVADTTPAPQRLQSLRDAIARAVRSIRSLGPYVAIEIILPGGSIIALALWIYRHRSEPRASVNAVSTAIASAVRRFAPIRCATPCTER